MTVNARRYEQARWFGADFDLRRAMRTNRLAALDNWCAAFNRGDDAEVERLVRQWRADRKDLMASGAVGALVGRTAPDRRPRADPNHGVRREDRR